MVAISLSGSGEGPGWVTAPGYSTAGGPMSDKWTSVSTCWIDLGSHIYDPKLLEEIGLTDDLAIVAPIIIGYPKAIPPIPPRNEPVILKTIS
jgi:hypothetical protein